MQGADEPTLATVSIADAAITEGAAGTQVLTFTVTRTNNTGAFTLDFATADGTAHGARRLSGQQPAR